MRGKRSKEIRKIIFKDGSKRVAEYIYDGTTRYCTRLRARYLAMKAAYLARNK